MIETQLITMKLIMISDCFKILENLQGQELLMQIMMVCKTLEICKEDYTLED